MVITNGFTYIAFLMFLAGLLLAAEKIHQMESLQRNPAACMDLCTEHDLLYGRSFLTRKAVPQRTPH